MAKVVISLDEKQVTRLEQMIIDHDENAAWELLHEIRTFKFVAHQQLSEDGWIAYVLSQM